MNQCQVCGNEFLPKPSNPRGVLCYSPACYTERLRQTRDERHKEAVLVPFDSPPGVWEGVCACGNPTDRPYSCEICFARMTWEVTERLLGACDELAGKRGLVLSGYGSEE